MAKAKQTHCMTANETRNFAVSFASFLDEGELLTGTPTVTAEGITLTNKIVNDEAIPINGQSVAIGKAVQFSGTNPTAGKDITIEILVNTTSTPPQRLEGEIDLKVK